MKRALLGLLAVLISSSAFAQTTQPAPAGEAAGPAKAAPQNQQPAKAWSLTGGVDYQTKYIFRGFTTTKSGLIVQPYGQFSYKVYDDGNLTISPYVGTWENVTSHPYAIKNGTTNNWRWLSESDIDAGATVTYKNFTLGLNYSYYLYPNGSIGEDQEAGFTLGYDDSDFWKNNKMFAAVNPHIAYYHEFRNTAGPNGGYLELGVEPTLKPINLGTLPVTLSAPLTAGLTTDKYYTDNAGGTETFGYFEAGVKASVPLTFLSNKTGGDWSLVGEVDYWHFNADNLRHLDNGKSDDVTARVGVTFKF